MKNKRYDYDQDVRLQASQRPDDQRAMPPTGNSASRPRRDSLVWRSLWHWDLWAAAAAGAATGIYWAMSGREPGWGWFGPVVALSVAAAVLAWQQCSSLRSLLQESYYGELVRIADRAETAVKLPYYATFVVALGSAFWSAGTPTATKILDSKWAEAPLLGVGGFLFAWSWLGMVTLMTHSWRHDKMRAELDAIREATAVAERRHKAKRQQARAAETTEDDAKGT